MFLLEKIKMLIKIKEIPFFCSKHILLKWPVNYLSILVQQNKDFLFAKISLSFTNEK